MWGVLFGGGGKKILDVFFSAKKGCIPAQFFCTRALICIDLRNWYDFDIEVSLLRSLTTAYVESGITITKGPLQKCDTRCYEILNYKFTPLFVCKIRKNGFS